MSGRVRTCLEKKFYLLLALALLPSLTFAYAASPPTLSECSGEALAVHHSVTPLASGPKVISSDERKFSPFSGVEIGGGGAHYLNF